MGEPLLGPDGGDDLLVGVKLDAEAAPVVVGHRLAQLRDALRGGVAVVPAVAGGLGQLLDGDLGGRDVGVPEAQVDHVLAGPPGRDLQVVDDGKDVRRQPGDAPERVVVEGHEQRGYRRLLTSLGTMFRAARGRARRPVGDEPDLRAWVPGPALMPGSARRQGLRA